MDKFTERLLQLVLTLWLMLILLWIGWHVIHLMYVLFQWLLKKILNIFCAWLLPVLKYPTLGFHYPSAMVFHRPEMSSRTFTNSYNVSTAGSNPVEPPKYVDTGTDPVEWPSSVETPMVPPQSVQIPSMSEHIPDHPIKLHNCFSTTEPPNGRPNCSNTNAPKLGRKERIPRTFNGTGDLEDFLAHFDQVARYNKWNEQDKGGNLALSLTEAAEQVWVDSDMIGHDISYDELVNLLRARFQPKGQEELFRSKFHKRRRQANESHADFGHAIKRLVRRAYPTFQASIRETLAMEHFMTEQNIEMRRYLRPLKLKSLDSMIQHAREFDLDTPQETVLSNNTHDTCSTSQFEQILSQVSTLIEMQHKEVHKEDSALQRRSQDSNKTRKRCPVCKWFDNHQEKCTLND